MKKTLVLLISIFMSVAGFSKPISDGDIRLAAMNFYSQLFSKDLFEITIVKYTPSTYNGVHTYSTIVFNDNNWVMVSADSNADPVLAFSTQSTYADSIPGHVTLWLLNYDYYVYNISANNIVNFFNDSLWNELLDNTFSLYSNKNVEVAPLLSTQWGQSQSNDNLDPNAYNAFTPGASGCSHTLVGCVAVTVGQILNYWQYPQCPLFQWSLMPSVLSTSSPNYILEKEEVAELLRNVGSKVYMNYGCNTSGASFNNSYNALNNYLGFTSLKSATKEYYGSHNDWKQLLISQLESGYPIFYAADHQSEPSAHAFVCDGYKDLFFGKSFHFNMGWNGSYDGYYRVNDIPNEFTENQRIIYDLYPTPCDNEIIVFNYYRDIFPFSILFYQPVAGTINSSLMPIIIQKNETVIYKAYNEIVLTNFETETGADFVAEIIPCPVSCNSFHEYSLGRAPLYTEYNTQKHEDKFSIVYFSETKIANVYAPSETTSFHISVFDVNGKLVISQNTFVGNGSVNLSTFSEGVYFLKIHSDRVHVNRKIIVL